MIRLLLTPIAVGMVVMVVTFRVLYLTPTPSAEVLCARQPGRVWLVSEQACIPANALWPAVERTP